jgi:glyoxylase-like metal-dependent hydrolase (beta-lactamase superfamily II)
MVVDPGDEPDTILSLIDEKSLIIKYIVCTHAHFDHVGAIPEVKRKTGAKIAVHGAEMGLYAAVLDQAVLWGYELEPLPAPDILLKDGDEISAGALSFRVIHTPGHSPGGICLYGQGVLITGDTLFAGSIGRTDFHGGSMEEILESLKKIASLPPETGIIAGHGPSSTVGYEVKNNPFYDDLEL